jgi:KaiC/GvpD/RAD55 family RecA-like ATPase
VSEDLKLKLFDLYMLYRKYPEESDIAEVCEFCADCYLSDKLFPTEKKIKEKFPKFKIDEMEMNEDSILSSVTEFILEMREKSRNKILLKLMNDPVSVEDRFKEYDKLIDIDMTVISSNIEFTTFESMSMREIYSEYKNRGGGILFTIPQIDEVTKGMSSGKIAVIFAPPGCFKTGMSINMVYTNILKGDNTMMLSLEIPKKEIKSMLLIRHAWSMGYNLMAMNVTKAILTKDEEEILFRAEEDFERKKKGNLVLLDSDDLPTESISSVKNMINNGIDRYGINTIYVDFIQQFKDFGNFGFNDEKVMLNQMVGMFRYVAVTRDVRAVILSQANRIGIDKASKEGAKGNFSITNISEINALERYASYIISLYLDDAMKGNGEIKNQLLKHRFGETIKEPKSCRVILPQYVIGDITRNEGDSVDAFSEMKVEKQEDGGDIMSLFGGK